MQRPGLTKIVDPRDDGELHSTKDWVLENFWENALDGGRTLGLIKSQWVMCDEEDPWGSMTDLGLFGVKVGKTRLAIDRVGELSLHDVSADSHARCCVW